MALLRQPRKKGAAAVRAARLVGSMLAASGRAAHAAMAKVKGGGSHCAAVGGGYLRHCHQWSFARRVGSDRSGPASEPAPALAPGSVPELSVPEGYVPESVPEGSVQYVHNSDTVLVDELPDHIPGDITFGTK